MASLWEVNTVTISGLANSQYPLFSGDWQYIFPHSSIAADGDIHIDMGQNSSGLGANSNNTSNSPIIGEVVNVTPAQRDSLVAMSGSRIAPQGIFRFYTEHAGERHFEMHPMTETLTWNGSAFVLGTAYRPNIKFVADGTTHAASTYQNLFNGSITLTAVISNDNTHVTFSYPSPSVNYVQYDGVALSSLGDDGVSPYFYFRPNVVPSAVVRCRVLTNTVAYGFAAALVSNQTVTVNALSRTDMGGVSNKIASMSAGQSSTFQLPVELITLSITNVGALPQIPVISSIDATNITDSSATITWNTDIPADGTVFYGLDWLTVTNATTVTNYVTNHVVKLTNLLENSTYFYAVQSATAAGAAGNDNGEAYFTFNTQSRLILFSETVESGSNGWSGDGLWHIVNSTDSCGSAYSPEHAWWYGFSHGTRCDYNTGASNSGSLVSSVINLPTNGVAWLDLRSREQTEGTGTQYDTRKIYISTNAGFTAWDLLYQSRNNGNAWYLLSGIALSNYVGATARLRFEFDTVNNAQNRNRGWYVDDIRVYTIFDPYGGTNTPPVLDPIGNKIVDQGNSLQFSVTATMTQGDPVQLTASNLPPGAVFSATNTMGAFTWSSAAPSGVFTTSFYAVDNDGATSETITITVNPSAFNLAPVANPDAATTPVDTPVVINVLANDTDANGDTLVITGITAAVHGIATIGGTGTNVTYSPTANYSGTDAFQYVITDGQGGFATGAVGVTVQAASSNSNCGVILSEYVEGTSNNKAIEIYNGSSSNVGLLADGYVVQISFNGGTSTNTISLTGSVASASTYVLAHTSASTGVLAHANQVSGSLTFNGNDVVLLRAGGSGGGILDSIGQLGNSNNFAIDTTLVRQPSVTIGDSNASDAFTSTTEWISYATDTFTNLGTHLMDCSASSETPPALDPIGDQSVVVSNLLQFSVHATPTDADPVTLSVSNAPAGATFDATNDNGTFAFTPNGAQIAAFTSEFYAADNDGAVSESVVITVFPPPNGLPVAVDDNAEIPEDESAVLNILSNDTDPEGDPLSIEELSQDSHGTVTIGAGATNVFYEPLTNYFGVDGFEYIITDGHGSYATGTVTLTITPVNDPPDAQPDFVNALPNMPALIHVLTNDTDVEGDTLSIDSVTPGTNGSTAVAAGSFLVIYTPDTDFAGADDFTYVVSDGNGGAATGDVHVTVAAAAGAGTNYIVDFEGTGETKTAYASGDVVLSGKSWNLTEALINPVSNDLKNGVRSARLRTSGTLTMLEDKVDGVSNISFYYGRYGSETNSTLAADYSLDAGASWVNAGTVAVQASSLMLYATNVLQTGGVRVRIRKIEADTVRANVDDILLTPYGTVSTGTPPILDPISNQTVLVDNPLLFTVHATPTESDAVTLVAGPLPAGATFGATNENGLFDWPVASPAGVYTTLFYAADDDGTAYQEVELTVALPTVPEIACPDDATIPCSASTDPTNTGVALVTDSCEPTQDLVVSYADMVTSGACPQASSIARVWMASNACGYSASCTQIITVVDVVAPMIVCPGDTSIACGDSTDPTNTGWATATDNCAPTDDVTIGFADDVTAGGCPQGSAIARTWTATDPCGNQSICTQSITISFAASNGVPEALADGAETPEDEPVVINVLTNDTDPDGDMLVITQVTQGVYGALTIGLSATNVLYEPSTNYFGTDTFDYVISDGHEHFATGSVAVTVTPVNDPPVAMPDSVAVYPGVPTVVAVLTNDVDAETNDLLVTAVAPPAHGSTSVGDGGSNVVYTASPVYLGTDTFTYVVNDGQGGSDVGAVAVDVVPDVDTDGDGLGDTFEGYLGTPPDNPDADGDGLSDGDEFVAGTSPTNFTLPASVFRVQTIELSFPGGTVISWPGASGRLYSIDVATDYSGGAVETIATNVPGTSGTMMYTSGPPRDGEHFDVRVRLAP